MPKGQVWFQRARFGASVAASLALLSGCESVNGTITLDGEQLSLVECRRTNNDAFSVALQTDAGVDLQLSDLGNAFIIGIGSGDCIRTEVQMGECTMGTMGGMDDCEPDVTICVERDIEQFNSCTRARVDISENGTERGGQAVVDVKASFDCTSSNMRTLTGEIDISNCT